MIKNQININSMEFKSDIVSKYAKQYISNINDIKLYDNTYDISILARHFDRDMNKTLQKITEGTTIGSYNIKDKYFIVYNDTIISINALEYKSYITNAFNIIQKGVLYDKAKINFEKEHLDYSFLKEKFKLLGLKLPKHKEKLFGNNHKAENNNKEKEKSFINTKSFDNKNDEKYNNLETADNTVE